MLSTSDDAHFKIWDLRQSSKTFTLACKGAEDGESLCVGQFNPLNEHMFAVAGASNGEVQIWDMRMPQEAINCLLHHSNQVCVLEWCPNSENILATGSDDNHIYVWDQAQCGSEQARTDYEDGPPELIFPHMYHGSVIEDIQWVPNPKGEQFSMMLASLETNMQFQIWQMNQEFRSQEIDCLHLADFVDENELE